MYYETESHSLLLSEMNIVFNILFHQYIYRNIVDLFDALFKYKLPTHIPNRQIGLSIRSLSDKIRNYILF